MKRTKLSLNGLLRLCAAVLLITFGVFLTTVQAQTIYPTWTRESQNQAYFTFPDGVTGTAVFLSSSCSTPSGGFIGVPGVGHNAGQNYPSNFYTPAPPNPLQYLNTEIDRDGSIPGCSDPNFGVSTVILIFNSPVRNLKMQWVNLDSSTYSVFDGNDVAVSLNRISGNPAFEIYENRINHVPSTPGSGGCESVGGTNPSGGCGTVEIPGVHSRITMIVTDAASSLGDGTSGDDSFMTMFTNADYGDAPTSYEGGSPAAHVVGLSQLFIGNLAGEADINFKPSANAQGDDVSGADDEDGVTVLQNYRSGGGVSCTGTLGTYTTAANEYCAVVRVTNTGALPAQLIAWNDANNDGDFLDANERTSPVNHPAVDDGTYTTANVPALATLDLVVVWRNLPQFLGNNFLRFRVTTDASFFSDTLPSPLGVVVDGEVEDYFRSFPTAAMVSASGYVRTVGYRGIRGAVVTIMKQDGTTATAVTNLRGFYSFDGIEAGSFVIVTVSAPSYTFEPSQHALQVLGSQEDLDFFGRYQTSDDDGGIYSKGYTKY